MVTLMSQQPQLTIPGPVATERIIKEQRVDGDIQTVISQVQQGLPVSGRYSAVRSQLVVSDGVLCRSLNLPLEGVFQVPIVPEPLVADVVRCAHEVSGHRGWEARYRLLCSRCYFPGIATACSELVKECPNS
eukprot:scpid61666/ scgid32174/ 